MIPVILSGGSGSRLWPLSRQNFPKQFCPLAFKKDKKNGAPTLNEMPTLMEQTLQRVSSFDPPLVITTAHLKTLTEKTLKEQGLQNSVTLYEPFGCNTAAAISLVCKYLFQNKKTSEIVGVFPADHLIKDEPSFQNSISSAIKSAENNLVVTLGITPTQPATGYGYIEIIDKDSPTDHLNENVFPVKSFHEKPNLQTAKNYLDKKNFFWNGGIFIFKVQTMITHLQTHASKTWNAMDQLKEDLSNLTEIYSSLENISIDHAVMEKLSEKELACVPSDIGWCDVGSWNALFEQYDSTKNNNNPKVLDTKNELESKNHVLGLDKKVYALNDVSDLIVVDTQDALLITKKETSQNVKDIVKKLEEQKDPRAKDHLFEVRPWGRFETLKETQNFKSKIITVDPESQISYQSHKKREEHWIITSGEGEVVLDDKTLPVKKGCHVHIPQQSKHRIRNTQDTPLTFIEVQLGSYFGEDDIIRYEDDYNRT